MANVTLGPFLVNNGQSGLVASNEEHTGYSIELSGDKFAQNSCIYRRIHDWQPNAVSLDDFYVSVDQISFELLPIPQMQLRTTAIGALVSLEALIGSLYLKHKVSRSITSVLEEFRQHLPLNRCIYQRREDGVKLVSKALREAGFEVIEFSSYGRTLSVQFGWIFPQDRQDVNAKLNVYAGAIEFKPQPDRTLNKGIWRFPIETTVLYLFAEMAKSLGKTGLLSEAGTQAALDNFRWPKVSLLTVREAKLARIDFVRKHPELHNNHQALAKALIKDELYSDTAEVYAIKKQIPRLIREAAGN